MNYKQYNLVTYVALGGALMFGGIVVKSVLDLPTKVENETVAQYVQMKSLINYLEPPANYEFIIRATKAQKWENDLVYYISTQDLIKNNIIKKTKAYSNLRNINNKIDSLSGVVQKEIEQILREEVIPEYDKLDLTAEVQKYKMQKTTTMIDFSIGCFGMIGCYVAGMIFAQRRNKKIIKAKLASISFQRCEDETEK
ncbi:MAG: hypothetical protein WC758_02120 [Candidatus Woesearchaeota archaeon]|jgi:hypothetical protein